MACPSVVKMVSSASSDNGTLEVDDLLGSQPEAAAPKQASTTNGDLFAQEATLYLSSLNDTFAAKAIQFVTGAVVRIGRKVNAKTLPEADNAFFDAKVLSRTHAQCSYLDGKVSIAPFSLRSLEWFGVVTFTMQNSSKYLSISARANCT